MKIISVVCSVVMAPFLMFVYWRNSVREISKNVTCEQDLIGWMER